MSKPGTKSHRRTTRIPVTTMEDIAVLSEDERRELQQALRDAEARVRAGLAIDYDPETFKNRLLERYRRAKR
jgi:hypothetical protein